MTLSSTLPGGTTGAQKVWLMVWEVFLLLQSKHGILEVKMRKL